MSVQLEALADEVFGAAAAQGRAGANSVRRPFGEVVWNPRYPELFFLNGVVDLVAPNWRPADLERALEETVPDIRSFCAYVRDSKTISTLGAALTASGYHHEIRVAMVQVQTPPSPHFPPPLDEGSGGPLEIVPVDEKARWREFEQLMHVDTAEHNWAASMRDQLIDLYHWRAEHTPTRSYIAVRGDRAVGHVGLFQHGSIGYLHALFTLSTERRRGVGSALTLAMDKEMRVMGAQRLTLQCTDDGYLPGFYHRLGFRRVGEQHIWTKLR